MKKDQYECKECGSTDVVRAESDGDRYPDDWTLVCRDCGNWEQVGNNRPHSFDVVEEG